MSGERTELPELYLGSFHQGLEYAPRSSVAWVHTGDGPLTPLAIDVSCPCLDVRPPQHFGPGVEETIAVALDPRSQSGRVEYDFSISTREGPGLAGRVVADFYARAHVDTSTVELRRSKAGYRAPRPIGVWIPITDDAVCEFDAPLDGLRLIASDFEVRTLEGLDYWFSAIELEADASTRERHGDLHFRLGAERTPAQVPVAIGVSPWANEAPARVLLSRDRLPCDLRVDVRAGRTASAYHASDGVLIRSVGTDRIRVEAVPATVQAFTLVHSPTPLDASSWSLDVALVDTPLTDL